MVCSLVDDTSVCSAAIALNCVSSKTAHPNGLRNCGGMSDEELREKESRDCAALT